MDEPPGDRISVLVGQQGGYRMRRPFAVVGGESVILLLVQGQGGFHRRVVRPGGRVAAVGVGSVGGFVIHRKIGGADGEGDHRVRAVLGGVRVVLDERELRRSGGVGSESAGPASGGAVGGGDVFGDGDHLVRFRDWVFVFVRHLDGKGDRVPEMQFLLPFGQVVGDKQLAGLFESGYIQRTGPHGLV